MSVRFTDEQLKAIEANGTVLVAAAAGSGKTAVLVERIIRRFCNEASPLMADRALIVTFTNAAAEELKAKIEKSLKERLDADPKNDFLKRQNMAFKRATVCTIDSFCISIVRENFNALNISRDFKISDSTNIEADYDAILDNFIHKKFQENDQRLIRVVNSLKSGYDEWYLKKIIKTIYNKSRSMPYPSKWLDGLLEIYKTHSEDFINSDWADYVFEKITCIADKGLKINTKLREYCCNDNLINEKYLPVIDGRIDFLKNIIYSSTSSDWDGCISAYDEYNHQILRSNYSKDLNVSALITESNSIIKEATTNLQKSFDTKLENVIYILNSFTNVLGDVITLIKEFNADIFENSKQNNAYTFDQIEHLALELFATEDNSAQESFNSMYDAILVDEYQDTSNLQDELFSLLSKQKKELFMVGDVKQSIYGFRNANPDNFLNKKDSFPLFTGDENPCKVLLTGNFRSRASICKFVNYLFSAFMTKADADVDYNAEEALVPMASFQDNGESANVEIKLLQNDSELNDTEYEAHFVADYIINTIKKPPFIDNGEGGLRSAEYKDFVLLMRSPGRKVNTFVQVFKERGIPLNCPSDSFKDSPEIITALALLKFIFNRNDSISLLTLLKSPVFSYSDEEIADIMCLNRYNTLYSNLQTAASKGNNKAKNFVELFKKIQTYYAVLPLDKLLNKIFAETFFIEIYSSLQNGNIKKANLRALLELAGKYNNEAGKGIKELVAQIENDTSNSLAVNLQNTENAVQITSIHKSKGLQYPICILCSTQARFNILDTTSQIICDDNYGSAFSFYDENYNSYLSPISSKFISGNLKEKIYKEELRLLYVALTRAKEKLVIVSTCGDLNKYLTKTTSHALKASKSGLPFVSGSLMNASSYSDWIVSAALYHKRGVSFRQGDNDFDCSNFDCTFDLELSTVDYIEAPKKNDTAETNTIDVENISNVFGYEYPYLIVNSVPAKTSVTDILKREITPDIAFKTRPGFITEAGLTAAEKGTATHKFMESCHFESAVNDIEAEIERLYEWEYISKKEAETIDRESIKAFFESYAFGLILKASRVYKEYRFISKVSASELNNEIKDNSSDFSIVQGVADCIIENDDGIIIIDYKTDSSKSEEYYKKEYSRQLEMYSMALTQIFKKPVKKCILYSFTMKRCIEI